MKKKVLIIFPVFLITILDVLAVPVREGSHKIAAYLTIIAIMISIPAFVSLYLHIRRTNLGHLLFQPFLAMFIGFFGIMLNSLIDIWRNMNGFEVDNLLVVMGFNRAISSILIAVGCVIMFLNMKKHGLFDYTYYQKKKQVNDKKKKQ